MERAEWVQQLLAAEPQQHKSLLDEHHTWINADLGWQVKVLFDQYESSDPTRAIAAAQLLHEVAETNHSAELVALAAWVGGMAAQLEGNLDLSLEQLYLAEDGFQKLERPLLAASTLVSKLISLAMLGRYDEALRTGLRARATFLAHKDLLATGKIEQNLGNIYFRRDDYRKAEQLYRTARQRFLLLDDSKQLAQIDNCLGSALTWQHKFTEAVSHYEDALRRAEAAGLQITQAEIESNLGGLLFFRGRYDQALDYLERSRRRYASLGLEHNAAITEKELAEAYFELNLIPEALTLFRRLIPDFERLGMSADLAWSLTHFARALTVAGRADEASAALLRSYRLHEEEGNPVGSAVALLATAQLQLNNGEYMDACVTSERAEAVFATVDAWEWRLSSQCLHAEATNRLGQSERAFEQLASTLTQAERYSLPQIVQRCLTALGMIALETGDALTARPLLERALAIVESMRATLPGEEFRLSFLADKTTPYTGLVAIALEDGQTRTALNYVERARSQSLIELVGGSLSTHVRPQDAADSEILRRLSQVRNELNWFYHQLYRLPESGDVHSAEALDELRSGANDRERQIHELMLQLRQRSHNLSSPIEPTVTSPTQNRSEPTDSELLDITAFQQHLGSQTALVEYYVLKGELLAFVVTDKRVVTVRSLCMERTIETLIRRMRFQIDALRYGDERLRLHMPTLIKRVNSHLRELYDLLLRPLESLIGQRRLAIVPYRMLHYVPFHALRNGDSYVIEEREISYAPSAGLLHHCLHRPAKKVQRAMLVGAPDQRIPNVRYEIEALAPLFAESQTWIAGEATLEAVRTHAHAADLLHLACHGHFRPDNPLFSSLQLNDGWFTVRDAYTLNLNCSLVTLSACETGMNAIAPGDELVGLVRGFFAAGAPSLLVSLWPVDDETTVEFMLEFYQYVLAGYGLAAALRMTQCALLKRKSHPFFWSPFILFGRYE